MKYLMILFSASLLLWSCKEDIPDYEQMNKDEIEQYISDNNLNAQSTASGLYFVIENPGNGSQPDASSTVRVLYKGYLTDGSVFDQTQGTQPVNFSLQSVIDGWKEGIPLFKKGGSGILLIPSKLAYGGQQVNSIPPYSVLIFEIELIDVL